MIMGDGGKRNRLANDNASMNKARNGVLYSFD
jgi:hypothetical protein